MDKELEDVRAFHNKFGILDSGRVPTMLSRRKLQERIECMQEELDELKKAVSEQNFPEQADALIDLVYFAKGTAVMMGLPWDDLWNDVQRANMSKVRGVGKRGHAVDMIKPHGWKKPDGESILNGAGFDVNTFSQNGQVNDYLCLDDDAAHRLFHDCIKWIKEAGHKVGDFMVAPCQLFNNEGKAIDPSPDAPAQSVLAISIRIGMANPEEEFKKWLRSFTDTKTFHMYQVIMPQLIQHEIGDEVDMMDPNTFTLKRGIWTQEMYDRHNCAMIRIGALWDNE